MKGKGGKRKRDEMQDKEEWMGVGSKFDRRKDKKFGKKKR